MLEVIHQWDLRSFQRISASRFRRTCIKAALILSKTGDGWLYLAVPLVLTALGAESNLLFLQVALTAFAIERLIYLLAKKGFKRRRPAKVVQDFNSLIKASDEFSFPSGHTSAAFLMTTLLVTFYGAAFPPLYLLYLWAAGVGFSRIIVGVHFPTDTLVGAAMGASIATFTCSWFQI